MPAQILLEGMDSRRFCFQFPCQQFCQQFVFSVVADSGHRLSEKKAKPAYQKENPETPPFARRPIFSHFRLKICRVHARAGSSPATRTKAFQRFANKYLSPFANNFANNLIITMEICMKKAGRFASLFFVYSSVSATSVFGFRKASHMSAISSCMSGVTCE